MTTAQLTQLRRLIKANPLLIWYTQNYDQLDAEVIVEAILNYGSWQQVTALHHTLGLSTTSKIFHELLSRPRHNFQPLTYHFFSLYYARHAS